LLLAFFCSPLLAQTPVDRTVPESVEVLPGLAFATHDELTLELNLYRPQAATEALPVIILVHGGGPADGSKETFGFLATNLAERGFAAISIDYRGYLRTPFPATADDVASTVNWVAEYHDDYQLDADKIGVLGGSYGGLVALYAATTSHDSQRWNGTKAIDVVVGFSALTDIEDFAHVEGFGERLLGVTQEAEPGRWRDASPINHVGQQSPPLLLIASDSDTTVPAEQSEKMASAYRELELTVSYHLLQNAHHAFWNYTEWSDETLAIAADFFWQHFAADQESGR